jgi:hypothetical protein
MGQAFQLPCPAAPTMPRRTDVQSAARYPTQSDRRSPHAIFACIVLTKDLAHLLGKALVDSRERLLTALLRLWPLPDRARFLVLRMALLNLCRIGREFKTRS